MFKELVFEIRGGVPRAAHLRYLFTHPSLSARVQTLMATQETIWENVEVHGSSRELDGFVNAMDNAVAPPLVGVEFVHRGLDSLQLVAKWRRPRTPEEGVSLEFLLYDLVGADGLMIQRYAGGVGEIHVAGSDPTRLLEFYRAVHDALVPRFTVRLLRAGGMRAEARPPTPRGGVKPEDRKLMAYALSAGYYDNPKRVGVRELGVALGWSKSVVARRLRVLERQAVEGFVAPSELAALP
ncbi:MAG: helix-turn-helix domain-containing protein [Thermoplasmatota archaeon]